MDWLADESESSISLIENTWKVLIVDDDDEVHKITQLSLMDYIFEGKKIEFVSAYSGHEAKELLVKHDDIAIVLLDVVMESDDAGLRVAQYIRDELHNNYTRVVLRTGQPGFAPVNDVMRDYDIDGYLAKTEITKQKLNHTLYIALRSYRDLVRIQKYQKGLEAVINAITNLVQIDEVLDLAQAVISQLSSVLGANQAEFVVQGADIYALTQHRDHSWRIAVDQDKSLFLEKDKAETSEPYTTYFSLSRQALAEKRSLFIPPHYVYYHQSRRGTESIFILRNEQMLSADSKKLLHAFSVQVVLALENLLLNKQV